MFKIVAQRHLLRERLNSSRNVCGFMRPAHRPTGLQDFRGPSSVLECRQAHTHSSAAFKDNSEILYCSISILTYFKLQIHYISEANIVPFTLLHSFDNFSYFADSDYYSNQLI